MKYLNPFLILNLKVDDLSMLDATSLRSAKKRLLAEIELDGNIIVKGVTISKSEALQAIDELDDQKKRLFHFYVLKNNGLLEFLSHGSMGFLEMPLFVEPYFSDPSFIRFVSPSFAFQFNTILFRLVKEGRIESLKKISAFNPPVDSSHLDKCYHTTYEHFQEELRAISELTEGIDNEQTKTVLPQIHKQVRHVVKSQLINALPIYFQNLRNELALTVRNLSVRIQNKVGDSETALSVLKIADTLKVDDFTRNSLQHDLEQLEEICKHVRSFTKCWFCEKNDREEGAERDITMYQVAGMEVSVIRYQYKTVSLPRCRACRKIHLIGTGLMIAVVCLAVYVGGIFGQVFIFAFAGILLGYQTGYIFRRWNSIKSKYEILNHPAIVESTKAGWEFGDAPTASDAAGAIKDFLRSIRHAHFNKASDEDSFFNRLDFKKNLIFATTSTALILWGLWAISSGVQTPTYGTQTTRSTESLRQQPSSSPTIPPVKIDDANNRKPLQLTPRSQSSQHENRLNLDNDIENGKRELRSMEADLLSLRNRIETSKAKIDDLESSIATIEQNARSGYYVDEARYERQIKEHNDLVESHNLLLRRYNSKYATYKLKLDEVNENIRQFNQMR